MKKLFFIALVLIGVAAASAVLAFSITPVSYVVTVDPGSSQTIGLKIINDGGSSRRYIVKVVGFKKNDEGLVIHAQGLDEAESWVYVESPSLTLKGGESKQVNFIIRVPKDTPAGSHYVSLAVEPERSGDRIATSLNALVVIQVSGIVDERIGIRTWSPADPTTGSGTWRFSGIIDNLGTIEVPLTGRIVLKNWRDSEVAAYDVRLGNQLLVGGARTVAAEITIPDGIRFVPGLYRAELQVTYGKTRQVARSLAYVWYAPRWTGAAAAFVALALAALVLRTIVRRRRMPIR